MQVCLNLVLAGKTPGPAVRVGLTRLTVRRALCIGETHRIYVDIRVVILGMQQRPTIVLVPPPRDDAVGIRKPLAYRSLFALGRAKAKLGFRTRTLP